MNITGLSAVTLATHNMSDAVRFYCALGFDVISGAEDSSFTSFRAGSSYFNLISQPKDKKWVWWGRTIFYVSDVDDFYKNAIAQGIKTDTTPRNAEWGERYFHLTDLDGHEISFAKPLKGSR